MEQTLLKDYFTDLTGIPDLVSKLKPIDANTLYLPRIFISYYDLYTVEILKENFVLAVVKDKIIGIRQARAHLELLKNKIHVPIIFLFEELNNAQQKLFIGERINFVARHSTVFLPALIFVQKKRAEEKVAPIKLSIWATTTILYQLNTNKLNGKSISDLADLFKISKMHASRAVDELKAAKLVTINQQGVYKKLQFQDKKELWSNALPYLENPVLKRVYTNDIPDGKLAGYTALGEYSMIDGGEQKTIAIPKKLFAKSPEITNTPADLAKYCIEVWEWDPGVIAKGKFVDQLSLYLSMRDNADDRTQIALKEILENVIGK
jgi:hypothetical protein